MSLGIIKNNYDYLIEREERNMDLDDEELQSTREMNKTAWESEIDKWSKEYLIERYKDLVEIEKEHKKENGKLRERIKEFEEKAYKKEYYEEVAEELYKNSIPKSKVAEILKQRLKKYQDADDGRYKQEYLTRGELELVDRYKECSELLKILCEEDIYKIELDYIPKSKVREKIEELKEDIQYSANPLSIDNSKFGIYLLESILQEGDDK